MLFEGFEELLYPFVCLGQFLPFKKVPESRIQGLSCQMEVTVGCLPEHWTSFESIEYNRIFNQFVKVFACQVTLAACFVEELLLTMTLSNEFLEVWYDVVNP
jgi:hypothetical protein